MRHIVGFSIHQCAIFLVIALRDGGESLINQWLDYSSCCLYTRLVRVYPGENIEIDFGKPEIATWGSLEISANGKDWSKVNFTQENNRLTASLQQKPIKAVRFTNMQHQEQEIYLRRFIITIDK